MVRSGMAKSSLSLPVETDIERRVRELVGPKPAISTAVELYHDLQIAGDDAAELLREVKKAYGVSFQGFWFSDYFPDETSALWYSVAARVGLRDRNRGSFTVGHLVAIARSKAWFDPSYVKADAR